jgi:hypothetical protein
MTDDLTIIVCARTETLARPIQGSLQRQCEECGCGIWVSPSAVANIPTLPGKTVRLQCGRCAIPVIITDPNPEFLPLQPNQIAELVSEQARRNAR